MGHDHVSFFLIVLHCFRTVLKYCVWYDILCVFVFFFFFPFVASHDDNGIVFILHAVCITCSHVYPEAVNERGWKRRERGQPWDISMTFQTTD